MSHSERFFTACLSVEKSGLARASLVLQHLLTTARSSCWDMDSRSGSWLTSSVATLLFFRDIGADLGPEEEGEGDLGSNEVTED